EGEDHDEGLNDRPAGRADTEKGTDVVSMPGRFGQVGAILAPACTLAFPALHGDVERRPPLTVVRGRAFAAKPDLAGRQVLEPTFVMQGGERTIEILGVFGAEMAAYQVGERGVHRRGLLVIRTMI